MAWKRRRETVLRRGRHHDLPRRLPRDSAVACPLKEYDFENAPGNERYVGAEGLNEVECQAQLRLLDALGSASKDVRWGKHGEQFFRFVREAIERRLKELG